MRMQLVEHPIERVFRQPAEVDAENVGKRRAPDPIRHGVLGARCDQPIEHHRTGQPLHGGGQPAVAQNAVELEALPELIADMDRTGLTMPLGGDARWIHLDQGCAGCSRRCRRGRRDLVAVVGGASCAHSTNNVGDFVVGRIEQIVLTDQGILDLARKLEPFRARSRAQVAERADRLLARAVRGVDGLHQYIIGVRPALIRPNRLADVHTTRNHSSA